MTYPRLAFILVLLTGALQGQAMPLYFQPIQVCDDAGGNCAYTVPGLFEAETKKIWTQTGIDIMFMDPVQLHETDYLNVVIDGHPGSIADPTLPNFFDLIEAGRDEVNDWDATGIINLFIAPYLNEDEDFPGVFSKFGWACGGGTNATPACVSSPAVLIAESVFSTNRLDTVAHEIGHVLGITHTNGDPDVPGNPPDNLMTAGSDGRLPPASIADIYPDGVGLSILSTSQITTALGSEYLTKEVVLPSPVPVPSPLLLILLGLAGVGSVRRHFFSLFSGKKLSEEFRRGC